MLHADLWVGWGGVGVHIGPCSHASTGDEEKSVFHFKYDKVIM